jgi:hypothetical protein
MAQIRANVRAIRGAVLTQHFGRTMFFWVPYPATSLSAGRPLNAGKTWLGTRLIHSPHHGRVLVGLAVGHSVGHDLGRKSLPECSPWAAGAHPGSIPARAQALMLRKDATGLRALGLKPASLLRTAPASLPAPRSRRAPAGQGQNQKQKGALDRPPKRCERSLWSGSSCASAPAPDRRHSPSLRSVASMSAVRRASRSKEKHRISRAWERSFYSRSLGLAPASLATNSVSAGALPSSFAALGRLIASPALWGPAQTSHNPRSSCSIRSGSLGLSPLCRHGAGCVLSPEFPPCGSAGLRTLESMSFQAVFKQHAKSFQRSISHHANHRISTTR